MTFSVATYYQIFVKKRKGDKLEQVIKLFKQIQNTSGLNDKKKIITDNKNNELFKKCLGFLLDGNVITGISDAKLKKNVGMVRGFIGGDFFNVINYLAEHNSGRDGDIALMQGFINSQPEEYREFYSQMITKKFRLGADAKLVNKCIPGLIPTFDVMLGTSIEKTKLKGDERIFISKKLNGSRCSFIGDKLMTRQGKEYTGLEHIIKDLQKYIGTEMFVDGELVYKNKEGLSDSAAFQKGVGLAMSKDVDKTDLKLVIFDMFPLEEFWNGQSKETYSVRREKYLIPLFGKLHINIEPDKTNISIVPMYYNGYDHSEIWKWLNYAEENDIEGVIINLDTPYECKRTKNLIKVKAFKEIDLRCVDINIATSGKYKGTMGSITCKYGNSTVDVGSGFNDEKRRHYTDNPNEILNHIITIKYKEETTNKNGGTSLQFPVFVDCRFDKNIADDE